MDTTRGKLSKSGKKAIISEVSKKLKEASRVSSSSSPSLWAMMATFPEEPAEISVVITRKKGTSCSAASSKDSSVTDWWNVPLEPIIPKQRHCATFDKLVGLYEKGLRNHQSLQVLADKSLVQNFGLVHFGYLQWMEGNASPTMADKSVTLSTVVEKFSKEAEQSLREAQKHMEAYYQIVAQATEEEIGELVENLPADSRAEMNHKAYDTAFAKIQSDG